MMTPKAAGIGASRAKTVALRLDSQKNFIQPSISAENCPIPGVSTRT
jgi:hypothetical protein